MVRGIYSSAAGMLTIEERTAMTANNLANVDTAGFKADMLLFTSAPGINTWRVDDPTSLDKNGKPTPEYIGLQNAGVMDTEVVRDFSQGQPIHTGRALDVAIVGDGFLRVMDNGAEYYTRNGQLERTPDGFLVDSMGKRVQGLAGDISLGSSNDVYINTSGEIFVEGALADRLDLAFFTDNQRQLSKVGDNLWSASAPPDGVGVVDVRSGYIERSNVDAIRCIMELIVETRHYDAAQRVIVAEDSTLEIAANQIGRMPQ